MAHRTRNVINTDLANGRVEFYTINGMGATLVAMLDDYDIVERAQRVMARSGDNAGFVAINDQMINVLVDVHNFLQRVTAFGEPMVGVKDAPLHRSMDGFDALPFVRGCLSDPWLYAQDEAYQQAAVLGIRKAQTIIRRRVEYLTGQ